LSRGVLRAGCVGGVAGAGAANQIYRWRQLYRQGLLADDADKPAAEWQPVRLSDVPATGGAIEIEFARGRVRIEGAAQPCMLRLVLEVLET
jgi:transposase-like protein